MATFDDDAPTVASYADHEVIRPPHKLRKAIKNATESHDAVITRAETALEQLSNEFSDWMLAECERLELARQEVKRVGFDEKTYDDLFRAAHDIKGEADTFGYPAVAGVANSLCRLIEHTPKMNSYSDFARRSARRCHARHCPRIYPLGSAGDRGRTDAALARGHRRVPDGREQFSSGLSRTHFGAVNLGINNGRLCRSRCSRAAISLTRTPRYAAIARSSS